jgi:hypothetical protein
MKQKKFELLPFVVFDRSQERTSLLKMKTQQKRKLSDNNISTTSHESSTLHPRKRPVIKIEIFFTLKF